MRASYDSETDILMIELSGEPIDHAVEVDNVIVHLDPANRPVLLEILDAGLFIEQASQLVNTPKGTGFCDLKTSA